MLGNKSSEKIPKSFLNIQTNIVTKKCGEINARNNFCRNTRIVPAKKLGKKSSEKRAKNFFLYSHEYRAERIGGNKGAKQFFQKHSNNANKKCWEKNRRKKVRKKHFLYSHEYRDQKMGGGKTR